MKEPEFDVAIVGASIAGCTAATLLGRQGARVALIESHADPEHYKVMCTHVLQGSAAPTLVRLGIFEELERAGARDSGVNVWSRYGWVCPSRSYMDEIGEDGHGLNLRRRKLDPMLRRMAAETDGVELLTGHTATGLIRRGRRTTGIVVRPRDGGERELRARLVVGADGRGSGVAKLAGLPTRTRTNNRFFYMAYYRDTPIATGDSPQVWFLDPDMVYAFPTDEGLTMLTCVPHKHRLPEFKADPEAAMGRLFATAPDAPRPDPAKRESKVLGRLDLPNERRPATAPGLALVGDAALAADPLWGVGCGWAFQSGEWLAEEVGPALSGGSGQKGLDRALARYARKHRRQLAGHNFFISLYSSGRGFNPAEKLFLRGAARDDRLAGRFALFGERWIRPQQIVSPSTAGLLLKSNLSPGARPLGLRRAEPRAGA